MQNLLDCKKEYTDILLDSLAVPICTAIYDIYKTSSNIQDFQQKMAHIKNWNNHIINEYYEKILNACDKKLVLSKLLHEVIVINIRLKIEDRKINFKKIPFISFSDFIHKCLINIGIYCWKNAYLFSHKNLKPSEKQYHLNLIEKNIRKIIKISIRDCTPLELILLKDDEEAEITDNQEEEDDEDNSDQEDEEETEDDEEETEDDDEEETEDDEEDEDEEDGEEDETDDDDEKETEDEEEIKEEVKEEVKKEIKKEVKKDPEEDLKEEVKEEEPEEEVKEEEPEEEPKEEIKKEEPKKEEPKKQEIKEEVRVINIKNQLPQNKKNVVEISDEEYEEHEVSGDEEMNSSSDDETEYTDKTKPKKKT
jgi:hypothetical protein